MSKDIFISYRNDGEGNQFANRLAKDLEHLGYSVSFNPNEQKSDNFPKRIENAIAGCKDFICVVTSSYLGNLYIEDELSWIRKELLLAKKLQKNIIPVLINNVTYQAQRLNLDEETSFFPKMDALTFPEQYQSSPLQHLLERMCADASGADLYRDVYASNEALNPDDYLQETLERAKDGAVDAMYRAAMIYFHGVARERDFKQAAFWLKKVANLDSPYGVNANVLLAKMYYAGAVPRAEQSYEKSYEHYQNALPSPWAAAMVAFQKKGGLGCAYDYDEIEGFYLENTSENDTLRIYELGAFYEETAMFSKAAEAYKRIYRTVPKAAYQLGMLYRRGVLTTPPKPNYHEASIYLKLAADQGNKEAAHMYATLFFRPMADFPKDFAEAFRYYTIAADGGVGDAQYILGYMYEYGHVEKNYAKAVLYYEKATAQGNINAAMQLATLYQQPEVQNYERAFSRGKYAAEHGSAWAEFVLGNLYLFGRGCESNVDEAYMCYGRAAKAGVPDAQFMLDEIARLEADMESPL